MRPTNSMVMTKLDGYSVRVLCLYRQQGTNIFRHPMMVVDSIWIAPTGVSTNKCYSLTTIECKCPHSTARPAARMS